MVNSRSIAHPLVTNRQSHDASPKNSSHTISNRQSRANDMSPQPAILSPPLPDPDVTQRKVLIPPPPLASSRYNRQLLIPSISIAGQTKIAAAKVLLVGLGGLGSPAALYLAGSGVHTLGFVDADLVETSNLHRQIVHREDSVRKGYSKVASAIRGCRELNSDVNYVEHELRLDVGNVLDVLRPYDIALDCTDNPATRYLISDACVLLGKVLVSGAAQRLEGQLMVLNCPPTPTPTSNTLPSRSQTEHAATDSEVREKGPCYRCIFPRPPNPDMVRGCSEIGILGPVVGTIGVLMASETLRIIVQGPTSTQKPNMLLYNAWSADARTMFRSVGLRGRRKDCLVCGDDSVLAEKKMERITIHSFNTNGQKLLDYVAFCGVVEDVRLLNENHRIDAVEFLRLLQTEDKSENGASAAVSADADEKTAAPVVVDVREVNEFALGTKVKGSINIPISTILRSGNTTSTTTATTTREMTAFEQLIPPTTPNDNEPTLNNRQKAIYFVCQRGNDSQIAAQRLMELREQKSDNDGGSRAKGGWIGDVRGGLVAMEKVEATDLTM